jgi:uncharacterized protein DUF3592
MMRKRLHTYLTIWVLLTIAALVFGILSLRWPTYYGLAVEGVATRARVTAKEPENHRFVRYSYIVDGIFHDGLGNAGFGNPAFEQISIGDEVIVYYDPRNPEVSFLGDAKHQLNSITRGVVFITVCLPLFVVLALVARDRKLARRGEGDR